MMASREGPRRHAAMNRNETPRHPAHGRREPLPEITIEAAARGFYKQAIGYGFGLGDFVRFANTLLGIAMAPRNGEAVPVEGPPSARSRHRQLPVVGPRVTVRRFGEPDDRGVLDRWMADREGRLFLLSTASGRRYEVDQVVQSSTNLLGMVMLEGRAIGCVAYLDHDVGQRRAELRKVIGEPDLRGRGLGREAAALWVGYGLGALGLKKIYLNTLAAQIANIKINEDLGFRVEGILRNEVLIDGAYHDVLRMGLWHE